MKVDGKNLTKNVQNLYGENEKTLKHTKENRINGERDNEHD